MPCFVCGSGGEVTKLLLGTYHLNGGLDGALGNPPRFVPAPLPLPPGSLGGMWEHPGNISACCNLANVDVWRVVLESTRLRSYTDMLSVGRTSFIKKLEKKS